VFLFAAFNKQALHCLSQTKTCALIKIYISHYNILYQSLTKSSACVSRGQRINNTTAVSATKNNPIQNNFFLTCCAMSELLYFSLLVFTVLLFCWCYFKLKLLCEQQFMDYWQLIHLAGCLFLVAKD